MLVLTHKSLDKIPMWQKVGILVEKFWEEIDKTREFSQYHDFFSALGDKMFSFNYDFISLKIYRYL